MQNYYQLLHVTPDAPAEVIQAAFRALLQLNHPANFHGREDEAIEVANNLREACDILSNPISRQAYDRELASSQPQRKHGLGARLFSPV